MNSYYPGVQIKNNYLDLSELKKTAYKVSWYSNSGKTKYTRTVILMVNQNIEACQFLGQKSEPFDVKIKFRPPDGKKFNLNISDYEKEFLSLLTEIKQKQKENIEKEKTDKKQLEKIEARKKQLKKDTYTLRKVYNTYKVIESYTDELSKYTYDINRNVFIALLSCVILDIDPQIFIVGSCNSEMKTELSKQVFINSENEDLYLFFYENKIVKIEIVLNDTVFYTHNDTSDNIEEEYYLADGVKIDIIK